MKSRLIILTVLFLMITAAFTGCLLGPITIPPAMNGDSGPIAVDSSRVDAGHDANPGFDAVIPFDVSFPPDGVTFDAGSDAGHSDVASPPDGVFFDAGLPDGGPPDDAQIDGALEDAADDVESDAPSDDASDDVCNDALHALGDADEH